MKRLRVWLLPVLTVLVVLTVTGLPQYLSAFQDQKLMGQVHTEVLATENRLPTQPPDLAQRMELLASWMESSDVMSAQQDLSGGDIYHELACAVLDELQNMAGSGILPSELLPGSIPSVGVYQMYLQRQLTGAEYYMFDTYIKSENVHLWAVLDGETKQMLWLELGHPAMERLYESLAPADIGAFFLDCLGIENNLVTAGKFDAVFQIADTDIQYLVSAEPYFLKISPVMTYPETDTEGTSASVG